MFSLHDSATCNNVNVDLFRTNRIYFLCDQNTYGGKQYEQRNGRPGRLLRGRPDLIFRREVIDERPAITSLALTNCIGRVSTRYSPFLLPTIRVNDYGDQPSCNTCA